MEIYTIITCQGTRNGFLIEAWDMGAAIQKARDYAAQGWKVFGIVAGDTIYESEMMLKRIYD